MLQPQHIIADALVRYNTVKTLLMVSGRPRFNNRRPHQRGSWFMLHRVRHTLMASHSNRELEVSNVKPFEEVIKGIKELLAV